MSKNNRVFVIFFSILLFLTVGMSEKAYQINFTTYHKTECLAGFPPCKGLAELKAVSLEYVNWFNYRRISSKTKGMSPCEYREHTLAA